ncbi:MAG: cell division protein FtsA [Alphaproteobacteria bacterium]|nr:cell division protein FtsA [Alphaproteobacteria bacterium]
MKKHLKKWLFAEPHVSGGEIFAALDIGSSKIACLIARSEAEGLPRIIGIGHQLSEGMRGGSISDMESLQYAAGQAVWAAEQMSGETIQRITVNISGAHLTSQTVDIELPLNGREATEGDVARIQAQGQAMGPEDAAGQPLELLHTIPVSYNLDGQKGIRDPVGMTGVMLHAQMHLIAAGFGPVRTLATAIARCHLDVDQIVASPYASGLACLVEDEMDLGSLIIDMGAGTTSYAVFADGKAVFTGGISIGGAHVTSDIARGLTTSLAHAERLKTLYGNAIPSQMDERESIDVPLVGEESPENANHVPKAHLIRIIQPRLEEIFELVRARMEKSGFNDVAGRRVVLTGGASQMPGVRELAQRILDRQVRLGRPLRVAKPQTPGSRSGATSFTGLADSASGPAFATTAGLLAIAMQPELGSYSGATNLGARAFSSGGSTLNRLGVWLKQSL